MTAESSPPEANSSGASESPAAALRTVLQITEVVSQTKDVADLIERALDAIVTYTRFPCCGLFLIDAAKNMAEMVAHRNVSAEVYAHAHYLPLDGSLTGLAIQRRSVVTTSDIAHDDRLEPNTRQALAREGFVEVASIPLIYRELALGTINLIYRAGDAISDAERDTLLGIGQTIAIALAHRTAEDEHRKLQEQVRKSEQIERLGLLAGGIAHDFNNFLTCILGSISLGKDLLLSGSKPEEIVELLDSAEKASYRATALVQRLLTFSKGGAPLLRPTTRLASLVRESAEFSVHGSSVRLTFELAPDLKPVEIDAAQISRMVQNLVINAVQASPEGASVTIEVKNYPPRSAEDTREWVRIRVTDQGSGIPPENLPHIFDPYFSTKAGGNGLGLPTVQSIVGAHGGNVEAISEVGIGTTFLVYLPTTLAHPPEETPITAPPAEEFLGGRAVVMDDDPSIRVLARKFLERHGYEVVATADGNEAVRACEEAVEAKRPFGLALLDLTVVGGLGGREAVPRIRALIPDIVAVVCSGYSEDASMSDYAEHGFDAVLPKPYTLEQFASTIRMARRVRSHSIVPNRDDGGRR